MTYKIQDIKETLCLVSEDIEKYIKSQKIKVGKDGSISEKSYQILIDFYSNETKNTSDQKNGKPIFILNGHKIEVKSKPYFESTDHRISIFQDDAINFLKGLPANSVDVIITDPAYSGMNQKLKLGSNISKWTGMPEDTPAQYALKMLWFMDGVQFIYDKIKGNDR